MAPSLDAVRAKLDAGLLPVDQPAILWIGHGDGQACAVCEQPILKTQGEFAAQYEHRPTIRFHADCYRLWRAELRDRGYSTEPPS